MKIIVNTLISAAAIYSCAHLFEAVFIDGIQTALLAAIILGILSITVKPILKLLTLPLTIITLGLFSFVLNGLILYIVEALTPGFEIANFGWAVLIALVVTFLTTMLQNLLGTD